MDKIIPSRDVCQPLLLAIHMVGQWRYIKWAWRQEWRLFMDSPTRHTLIKANSPTLSLWMQSAYSHC